MTKILSKIILGNDFGRMIVEKILRKIIKDNLGIDVAMTIKQCDICGTEHNSTIADIHVNVEIANDDLIKVVNKYV